MTDAAPAPWLVVDGHESDSTEAALTGDGQFPPFYVFDANAQGYVTGPVPTRNAAERLRALILRSGAGDYEVDPYHARDCA